MLGLFSPVYFLINLHDGLRQLVGVVPPWSCFVNHVGGRNEDANSCAWGETAGLKMTCVTPK